MTVRLIHGDCIEGMQSLPDNSVDAVCTDPPYGLEFMGKEWDRLSIDPNIGKARRVGLERPDGKPDQREGNKGGTWFGSRESQAPNYYRTTNAKCRKCGKWRVSGGHDGKGNTLGCQCSAPDFPNVQGEAARQMQEWHEAWAREALRVLKPGGYLVAFGGTRTYHRLACAVEDAGFVVRDSLHWLYGSGFPKSHDISKALDKAAGAEREVVGTHPSPLTKSETGRYQWNANGGGRTTPDITAPATDLARQWAGFGTALKPAHEPIVLAQKPLDGTYANNVVKWGCGALNVAGCRVTHHGNIEQHNTPSKSGLGKHGIYGESSREQGANSPTRYHETGRWPPNLLLSHAADCADTCAPGCPVKALDEQSGRRKGSHPHIYRNQASHWGSGVADVTGGYADTGGASRFFPQFAPDAPDVPFRYCPKASRAERNRGCEGLPEGPSYMVANGSKTAGSANGERYERTTVHQNTHPTVKPVALMRWLVRLVCPPGGVVLDPFAGSGTTGVACVKEGVSCIAIEREAEYLEIACARVAHAEVEARGAAGRARQLGLEVAD